MVEGTWWRGHGGRDMVELYTDMMELYTDMMELYMDGGIVHRTWWTGHGEIVHGHGGIVQRAHLMCCQCDGYTKVKPYYLSQYSSLYTGEDGME